MLNRQLSSSSKNKNKKHSSRSPLRDFNCITGSESSSSSYSSSMSVEAPRGCLRFLLSNSSASKTPLHRPKALSKTTHKSAPNAKPSKPSSSSSRSNKPLKENLPKLTSHKDKKPNKNPPCLYQWQSGKKPNSKTAPKPKPSTGLGTSGSLADNPASVSEEFTLNLNHAKEQQQCVPTMVDESGEPPELLKLPDLSTGAVENSTPVAKLACGSSLGCPFDDKLVEDSTTIAATTNTTPPVQASVSPEIQCGSSMLLSAATPACYGAGHIVSGVTDRRKCRARGILTVGEIDSNCGKANIFDSGDDIEIFSKSRMSLVPLPAEASMWWLLSPCDEEVEDQKNDLENGLHCLRKSVGSATLHSVSSPSLGHGISSDLCNIFENSTTTSTGSRRKTRINLLSPIGNPACQGLSGASSSQVAGCSSPVSPHAAPTCEAIISQEDRKHRYDLAGENSPFSIDSLGSGNVIQTPQSNLSSDGHVGLSWLNAHDHQKHDFGCEIDSMAEVILRASLSPKTQISIWDPPGLNFQFSDLISPANLIDLTQLPYTWDNRASCISNSTLDDMSRSEMRISWRDGLVSRIFEMDEFDCCRCLSDDEKDTNECNNDKFKSSPSYDVNVDVKSSPSHDLNVDVGNVAIFSNGFGSPEVVGHEPTSDGKGNEKFSPQISNPCAESICTDGGGLVASGDSDWTLCYKNQLFEF